MPALAQSDIQVTLEEGNKTMLDKAGGSLQVVTGLTEFLKGLASK